MPIDPHRLATRLGKRIATVRRERGLSPGRLASEVHTSAQWIVQLERGARSPTLHMLCMLANALGVPLADLMG